MGNTKAKSTANEQNPRLPSQNQIGSNPNPLGPMPQNPAAQYGAPNPAQQFQGAPPAGQYPGAQQPNQFGAQQPQFPGPQFAAPQFGAPGPQPNSQFNAPNAYGVPDYARQQQQQQPQQPQQFQQQPQQFQQPQQQFPQQPQQFDPYLPPQAKVRNFEIPLPMPNYPRANFGPMTPSELGEYFKHGLAKPIQSH